MKSDRELLNDRIDVERGELLAQVSETDKADTEKLSVLSDKIQLLNEVKKYLSGEDIDLIGLPKQYPQYNYRWLPVIGWYHAEGSLRGDSTTGEIFNTAKTIRIEKKIPIKKNDFHHEVSGKSEISAKDVAQNIEIPLENKKSIYNDSSLLFFALWQNNLLPEQNIPPELIQKILWDKNTVVDFEQALKHVVNGELNQLKICLDKNHWLVLCSGSITTPGGLKINNQTLLEVAIGAGDWNIDLTPRHDPLASLKHDNSPGIIESIMPYFYKVEGGEEALKLQIKRCENCLEELINQESYDFTDLISSLKKASIPEIAQVKIYIEKIDQSINSASMFSCLYRYKDIKKDIKYDSDLFWHFLEFVKKILPNSINEPHMHYNYQTFITAIKLFENNKFFDSLNDEQKKFFGSCIIGFLQRSLPALERMMCARRYWDMNGYNNGLPLNRSTKFYWKSERPFSTIPSFPDCSQASSSIYILGKDYMVNGQADPYSVSDTMVEFFEKMREEKIACFEAALQSLQMKHQYKS
jgi:hypothetical protein